MPSRVAAKSRILAKFRGKPDKKRFCQRCGLELNTVEGNGYGQKDLDTYYDTKTGKKRVKGWYWLMCPQFLPNALYLSQRHDAFKAGSFDRLFEED